MLLIAEDFREVLVHARSDRGEAFRDDDGDMSSTWLARKSRAASARRPPGRYRDPVKRCTCATGRGVDRNTIESKMSHLVTELFLWPRCRGLEYAAVFRISDQHVIRRYAPEDSRRLHRIRDAPRLPLTVDVRPCRRVQCREAWRSWKRKSLPGTDRPQAACYPGRDRSNQAASGRREIAGRCARRVALPGWWRRPEALVTLRSRSVLRSHEPSPRLEPILPDHKRRGRATALIPKVRCD